MIFGEAFYILAKNFQNLKTKLDSQNDSLRLIAQSLISQQTQIDQIEEELDIAKTDSDKKAKELENILASESEKRIDETKKLEEKIRQAELRGVKTESLIKAQEESAQEKISALEEKISKAKAYDTTSIISQWKPLIANVQCEFRYSDTGRLYYQTSGSGIAIKFGNTPSLILTNKHVITDSSGYGADSCKTKLLESGETISGSDTRSSSKGYDLGYIYINNPSSYLEKLTSQFPDLCSAKPSLGDEIIVLGYPSIGSKDNLTATEGIISGFDDKYFITSAKVEQGNSGGAAILLKDNCLLGIPTFVTLGKVESLARILDIWTAVEN